MFWSSILWMFTDVCASVLCTVTIGRQDGRRNLTSLLPRPYLFRCILKQHVNECLKVAEIVHVEEQQLKFIHSRLFFLPKKQTKNAASSSFLKNLDAKHKFFFIWPNRKKKNLGKNSVSDCHFISLNLGKIISLPPCLTCSERYVLSPYPDNLIR